MSKLGWCSTGHHAHAKPEPDLKGCPGIALSFVLPDNTVKTLTCDCRCHE